MTDPIKALIAAARNAAEAWRKGMHNDERMAIVELVLAADAAEARPEPAPDDAGDFYAQLPKGPTHGRFSASDRAELEALKREAFKAARPEPKPPSLLDLHGLGKDVAPHVEPAAEPSRMDLPEGAFDALIQEATAVAAEALAVFADSPMGRVATRLSPSHRRTAGARLASARSEVAVAADPRLLPQTVRRTGSTRRLSATGRYRLPHFHACSKHYAAPTAPALAAAAAPGRGRAGARSAARGWLEAGRQHRRRHVADCRGAAINESRNDAGKAVRMLALAVEALAREVRRG